VNAMLLFYSMKTQMLILTFTFLLSSASFSQKKTPEKSDDLIKAPAVKEIPITPRSRPVPSFYNPPNATPPPQALAPRMQKFFEKIIANKIEEAYREILADSTLTENPTNLRVFIEKTTKAFELYGRARHFEIYDHRKIGERMLVLTYLTAQPIQPLRWRFVFYRPENAWRLIDLRVDDALDDLLQ
jgi:hypothetical protein